VEDESDFGVDLMATKRKVPQTHKQAASAASFVLKNPKATKAAKSAAGSALAQTGRPARTGKAAASSAGKALSRKVTSPRGRTAAASALAQTPRKKKAKAPQGRPARKK
jgi:hypothetical protein